MLQSQLVAGSGCADASFRDDDQVVAEPLDDVELVAGEQHGRAGGRAILEHVDDDLDGERVESGERLVEHEDLGVVHECGGDLRALLVAERELLDRVAGALGESESLKER